MQFNDFRCIHPFSFVAKGHQTIASFPPPPLKFRTVGFPQYGFKPDFNRDLHPPCELKHWTRIRSNTPDLYAAKVPISIVRLRRSVSTAIPPWQLPVQRPLARQQVMCPAGSSLTMASSEPLGPSRRFIVIRWILALRSLWAGNERVPNLLCSPFSPCRLPYPGGWTMLGFSFVPI